MQSPKVSVIIPVYKVENYLVQCLESVVNQTLREIEIIIVDEGDLDRCREIIDYYEKIDPRVVTIHEKNGGYGASVNKGIDRATGEYIGIVESDDFIELDMYEQLYAYAKKTGASVVKSSFYCYFDEKKHFVDASRKFINQYVPINKKFSIVQFPHLLAIHPSLWSGLYKTAEMKEKHVRCIEAKGSGYADARFYVDIYTKMDSLAWLDIPFYHWRMTSEGSSCNNWNYSEILKRWNENLDLFAYHPEQFELFAPFFVTKSFFSIFRHYQVEKAFNIQEYQDLVQYLNRFSSQHILTAPNLSEKQKQELMNCRNTPEQFLKILQNTSGQATSAVSPSPFDQFSKICHRIVSDKKYWAVLFYSSLYFLLFGMATGSGLYSFLLPRSLNIFLLNCSAVLSPLCIILLLVCCGLWMYRKMKKVSK
ncbi:glycosyltransferase family 2 protein [Harryflintia acetispora]|uniref:glycosyltransferase family 2 protein n=1 Tax=Harryflintia acetispora TaxID=1849041 RepID=UPI0018981CA9|nr:glycosyltransferase family 2 protein [Harryflintia acetispora]